MSLRTKIEEQILNGHWAIDPLNSRNHQEDHLVQLKAEVRAMSDDNLLELLYEINTASFELNNM